MQVVFPVWPAFSDEEADAVRDVILSNKVNYWTGTVGRQFEQAFARWAGTSHAIALANGTLALDVALKALGIGPGDEVIVTPRTFIASASCVVTAGATPVFADVDLDSGNISPQTVEPLIGPRTKAIIPVHLAGWPADMPGFEALASQFGIPVIEDCAQAHGARIDGRAVGSFGVVGAWSFCQDKIMTTGGEGGMVTTSDPELWSHMWSYKDHGKSWDAVYERSHPPGFRWVHESIGTNWRMLEMQAAIGQIQLGKLADWTARRTRTAEIIADALAQFPNAIRLPVPAKHLTHAYYRLYAYVRDEGLKTGWDRDRIVAELLDRGAPVMHGTCSEVYLEKAFEAGNLRPAQRLPSARLLGETSVAFLTHPTLDDNHAEQIAGMVRDVLSKAVR